MPGTKWIVSLPSHVSLFGKCEGVGAGAGAHDRRGLSFDTTKAFNVNKFKLRTLVA